VFGTDLQIVPRGITSEDDIEDIRGNYICGIRHNSYDTTSLVVEFKQKVDGDSASKDAMDLFLDCKYWNLVDYCEDNLHRMIKDNEQLFREALVLLAPHLNIGNYTKRVVDIIGDPTSITPAYFKNRILLYNMFFYGATECAKRGYTWIMTETCASICDELRGLAGLFHWDECAEFNKIDVRDIAYDGACTEDYTPATATCVWPNLPDAFAS
jgi:hypothetical protein